MKPRPVHIDPRTLVCFTHISFSDRRTDLAIHDLYNFVLAIGLLE